MHRLVTALEERGFLRRIPHHARSIEILKLPDALYSKSGDDSTSGVSPVGSGSKAEIFGIPLMGRIAAGVPAEAICIEEDRIRVPADMIHTDIGRYFALRVSGDSMIGAGILDGDIAIICRQEHALDGDVVVALVDRAEATLKKFYRQGSDKVVLESANPNYPSRVFDGRSIAVQGRLAGLVRKYEH